MAVRAITFDFWCTLFRDANGEARQKIRVDALAKAAKTSTEEASKALQAAWGEFSRSHMEDRRTLCPEDAVRLALDSLNKPVAPPVMRELADLFGTAVLSHPPVPIEGALEAVRAAAALRPVGLISDTGVSPGSSLRLLLDRNGFSEFFKTMTFSDEAGVSKPQRSIFKTTATALGVGPDELLHIGDIELTDVAGAKGVGAKAALFAGDNKRYANGSQADYVFRDWSAFVDALPEVLRDDSPRANSLPHL